ncbi:RidA family protein [uncultured Oscillibacter sp.]|uniref:RidA family protein n=1 Tax=uncultured Oscillibacter sp. TaxID=876091 RepID=UPI002629AB40|nr:RidA family protein [uncultured Oscillibacter sp.]
MQIISTSSAPAAIGPYSQAISAGDFLFVSGQTGLLPSSGEVPGNTIEIQAEQCCRNVRAILDANGMTFENVVKTTCFLVDMADFAAFNAVYEKHFVSKPARSCVAVRELPKKLLCEIEVIAVKA